MARRPDSASWSCAPPPGSPTTRAQDLDFRGRTIRGEIDQWKDIVEQSGKGAFLGYELVKVNVATFTRGVVPGTQLALLRPLLGWRRDELAGIVDRSGLEPARDPSNEDPKYDRTRIREALKAADWLDVPAIAASAAHCAEAETILQWVTQREWEEAVEVGEGEIRYRPKAPGFIRARVLVRAIGMLGVEPRISSVLGLIGKLQRGKDATLGGVVARVDKDCWTLRKEPPRRIAGLE